MKLSYYLLAIFLFLSFTQCQDDDTPDPDPDAEEDNGGEYTSTSCEELPQYVDDNHEQFFSMLGSSCVSTSYYEHNQIGHATLVESNANESCTISDEHYFKIHLGHADIDDETLTFDVDVYLLTDTKFSSGDEIDLAEDDVNVYYSYTVDGEIKMVKATSGLLTIDSSDEADFSGEFEFEGKEFERDAVIDSAVKGNGAFVDGGDEITVSGRFLLQDSGVSPDCE